MKLVRTLSFALAVGVSAIGAAACGGSVEAPQSASSATKAPVGAGTHGFVRIAGEALGEVPLRAEQRTELEKLAQEADARHSALVAGRKELLAAIADQVEKGTVDRAALQPKIDRVVGDLERVRPEDRAALARVHALLDAEQRSAFVDALEKRHNDVRGEHHGMKGFARLKQLADELKLTDAQRDRIKEALRSAHKGEGGEHGHHAWKAHRGGPHGGAHFGKKAFESFRSDTFDANAFDPPGDLKERAATGTTRILGVAETIIPVLTPEQRKLAADKLRDMAQKGELRPFVH